MSNRRSFIRKIIYICVITALLLPLSWLSAPATRGSATSPGREGGLLAQMRAEHKLSQANLGEIDPAGETIKLATLGMRGVAANILWGKANHYKKTEDWTNLSATLEQITKLQPNFISVWQFQAWNLSYNVSTQFDDYRDRYYWVMRGIDFLQEGVIYNEDSPRLLWDIGWFIAQKIGRADEYKQYRRLFKADDNFHPADRPYERRDNWLVGQEWFRRAERAVDIKKKPLQVGGRGKSELVFFADAPMCQINYSDAIEAEGIHAEVAREAWRQAGKEWQQFGDRQLLHSSGQRLRLNDKERFAAESKRLGAELDQLVPGVRKMLREEKDAALSAARKKALATPPDARTSAQHELAAEANQLLAVSDREVAERTRQVAPEKTTAAFWLARAAAKADSQLRSIELFRQIVNYQYWQLRCQFEQTADALTARARVYAGDQAFAAADLVQAKKLYDEGLAYWRKVLDSYPSVANDPTTGEDLMDTIKRYREILGQIDEPFPEDFPLLDIIRKHDRRAEFNEVLEAAEGARAEKDQQTQPPANEQEL